ncbi:hypothetical protein LYSIN_01203 [Lysinibacillus sphaericus]|uniref:J domain-containing protein n=1 Tax=Lysinibacillus sphaericus TaxID=1421 RepID=A0A2S5D018_LYSSH|nr:hypothetical protein [Lysinibacillus sphaericus]POZ56420.1 hypothetical protein LYSIN_01203 [Lysinibacillus sphaericus]
MIQKIKYKTKEEFKNKARLETELRTSNRFRGCSKKIEVSSTSWGYDGVTKVKYSYKYSEEKFERNELDAYKISIHHSYREDGKVKKKQWAIGTVGYYDFIDHGSYDYLKVSQGMLDELGITEEEAIDMIYEKLTPIEDMVKEEFEKTAEFREYQIQRRLIGRYSELKAQFRNKYGVDEYDYVYNIFGELMNKSHLEKLEQNLRYKEESERIQREQERKAYDEYFKNFGNGSSYSSSQSSNHTDDEKTMLKEIYRMASKKFHPDACGDDGSKMKFLTKLKEQWGL